MARLNNEPARQGRVAEPVDIITRENLFQEEPTPKSTQ